MGSDTAGRSAMCMAPGAAVLLTFFITAIVVGGKQHLIVVLLCVSLIAHDVEHLFICRWPFLVQSGFHSCYTCGSATAKVTTDLHLAIANGPFSVTSYKHFQKNDTVNAPLFLELFFLLASQTRGLFSPGFTGHFLPCLFMGFSCARHQSAPRLSPGPPCLIYVRLSLDNFFQSCSFKNKLYSDNSQTYPSSSGLIPEPQTCMSYFLLPFPGGCLKGVSNLISRNKTLAFFPPKPISFLSFFFFFVSGNAIPTTRLSPFSPATPRIMLALLDCGGSVP